MNFWRKGGFEMKQMMDAIVKPTAGPGLELRQVPVPVPGPGEVLIKIHKTAICGSDVHIYKWNQWAQQHVKPPQVIGHEYVGEVAELGAGVTGFTVGQRVSGEGHITCGHCRNCHTGNIQWCKHHVGVGVDRDGAFAEYVCIPSRNVIAIDESLPEDVVSFFDAFGNATHTALTRKMGVDAAVNTAKEDLREVMHAQGLTEGFDVGLEMSGNAAAFHQLISVMRSGGKVSLLGLGDGPISVDMNQIITNGLTLQGIYGRKMDNWHQMSYMVQGGLDLTPVITHRFHYTDFQKGFDAMMSGKSGKVVLDWTK